MICPSALRGESFSCKFVAGKQCEGEKEAGKPFKRFWATVGRLVSLTFVVCRWEERAEHRLVGLYQ